MFRTAKAENAMPRTADPEIANVPYSTANAENAMSLIANAENAMSRTADPENAMPRTANPEPVVVLSFDHQLFLFVFFWLFFWGPAVIPLSSEASMDVHSPSRSAVV